MSYTIKQLAELSGVTTRTLRYYDEIGLLKPAYYNQDNNYRYYDQEQLLLLQQILFYRELGFPLSDIKNIMSADNFDKIEALNSHKKLLKQSINQTNKLINTIDKTLLYLKGKTDMSNYKDLFEGFDEKKQREYEEYLVKSKKVPQSEIDSSHAKLRCMNKRDIDGYKAEGSEIILGLAKLFRDDVNPDSQSVQDLIHRHYNWICIMWTPDQEKYIGLGQLYSEHEDFRKFYDEVELNLSDFIAKAMKIYAEFNL